MTSGRRLTRLFSTRLLDRAGILAMAALRELLFKGTRFYVTSFKEANMKCKEIRARHGKEFAMGFDMEYGKVGDHLNKSALMQICPDCNEVYIFHLAAMMKDVQRFGLPDNLRELLLDEKISKAGVNIHDDILRLNEDIEEIKVGRTVELSDLAYKRNFHRPKEGMWGLDELVEKVLERRMPHLHHLGHWGNEPPLDEKHLKYATFHAYAPLRLYKKLSSDHHRHSCEHHDHD